MLDPEAPHPASGQQSSEPFKPELRYGMLHDLESCWWIAIWFLFRTVPKDYSRDLKSLGDAGEDLFSRQVSGQQHLLMLNGSGSWESRTKCNTKPS
jgi:hypothetical protein